MATIDEEKKRRTAFPTNLPESGYLKSRPVPPTGFEAAGQRYAQGMQRAGLMPGPASKPGTVDDIGGSTAAVVDGAVSDAARGFKSGNYAQGVGAAARGAATLPFALGFDALKTLRPVGDAASGFVRGLTGGMDDATGAVKAGSPQAQDPNRGQPMQVAPTALEKSIPITSPDMNGKPPGENPAGEVTSSAQEIAPGVFKQGRGQYSDSAEGMGFAPGFTGRPNAQNMAAAEALAQRRAARGFQPQPMQQQVEQPRLSGSGFGILDRDYQERRAAMMDAGQLKPGARTALRAVLQQQAQRPGMELERDKMAAGERAGAADRDMRQQELTARMGDAEATRALRSQEVGDNMATNAVRREAAGFEVEAARQLQGLRQQFMAAKTDKERSEIAAKIQALQGKAQEQANRFTVVPGGQEIQMVGGFPTPVTRPSMVLNNQTGQFVGQEGMGMQQAPQPLPPKDQLQPNSVYQTPRGPARWDGKQFIPI